MTPYPTGFRQLADERDFRFPLGALLTDPKKSPVSKNWKPGPVKDQGNVGACVGHACWQFQVSDPILKTSKMGPFDIWGEARKIDEFDDRLTEGTSVRAGLNVLKREGIIKSYHWASSMDEVVDYLLKHGPLVFGTRWSDSMFSPDSNGFIKPVGRGGGGHAYFVYGANIKDGYIKIRNSWGSSWGLKGDCKMIFRHADELLKSGGVAAAVVE